MLKTLLLATTFMSSVYANTSSEIDDRISPHATLTQNTLIHVIGTEVDEEIHDTHDKSIELINKIFRKTSAHQIKVPMASAKLQGLYIDMFAKSYLEYTKDHLLEILTKMLNEDNIFNPNIYHEHQTREINFIWDCALNGIVIRKFFKKYVCPEFEETLYESITNIKDNKKSFYIDMHFDGMLFYSDMTLDKVKIYTYEEESEED